MPSLLTLPRTTTWETLQRSRNIAAISTLACGLGSTNAELRGLCLRSLLTRDDELARRAIVLHWAAYLENDIELLYDQRAQFGKSTKELLAHGSLSEQQAALAAIRSLDLHDGLEELLEIVVDPAHALRVEAAQCLSEICTQWGARARAGKDVPTVRGRLLDCLQTQLAKFHEHESWELVDAWLATVHWDDALQRGLISDSSQVAYRAVMARLRESENPPIMQLLAGYLGRAATPKSVLNILVERRDTSLATEMTQLSEDRTWQATLKRLQHLPPLTSLTALQNNMPTVDVETERRLWLMIAASSDDLQQVLQGALLQAKAGARDSRQTAAEMLRLCRRPELDTLVPALQSADFQTLEGDVSLGALTRQVAQWLDSPSRVLRKAAREFLQEFTVDKLLAQIRVWPAQMCKSMSSIVVLVETDVTQRLTQELQNPAPRRRLAALQVIELLECADAISQTLMPLLKDPRLEVRVRTIDLLAALGHESLEQLLPQLLADANTDIQDAANRAARRLQRAKTEIH